MRRRVVSSSTFLTLHGACKPSALVNSDSILTPIFKIPSFGSNNAPWICGQPIAPHFPHFLTAGLLLERLLQARDACTQVLSLGIARCQLWVEVGTRCPPVNAHFACLVHGADKKTDLNRQQLDIHDLDLDVAGDHQTLVKDAFQNIRQGRGAGSMRDASLLVLRGVHLRGIHVFYPVERSVFSVRYQANGVVYSNLPSGPISRFRSLSVNPNSFFSQIICLSNSSKVKPRRSTSSSVREPPSIRRIACFSKSCRTNSTSVKTSCPKPFLTVSGSSAMRGDEPVFSAFFSSEKKN